MKTFYNKIKSGVGLSLILGVTIFGCESNLQSPSPTAQTHNSQLLTFKNFKEFSQTADKLFNQPVQQQMAWEAERGFVSLKTLFKKVQDEEEANYDNENKLYATNPALVTTHQKSATAKSMPDMIIYDTVHGGELLNVSDPRFATLLNKDGMVIIGNMLYQFTYWATKSMLLGADEQKAVATLKAVTTTQPGQKIFVTVVKHTISPMPANSSANARISDYDYVNSCENASGSPFKYELIGYFDEIEGVGYTECDQNGYCYDDSNLQYNYSALVVTLRTLKRGTFGGWYDRSTSLQSSSGTFWVTSTSIIPASNNWTSPALSGGSVRPFNIYASHAYSISNNSGETATWQAILFLSQNSDYTNPGARTSNVRFANGSSINVDWNGDYNCHCSHTY